MLEWCEEKELILDFDKKPLKKHMNEEIVVRNIRSVVGKIDIFGKVADIIPINFLNKGRRTPGNGFVCPFFCYAICKKM